ncbi:MAG: HAD-IA family hydrolase, partial [Bacteroidales bacterium]|nr:HAD-IA family hydrolase [Bacteroidales bacterium]
MKEYLNYIFDFDYTLFDTSKGMDQCYKNAFSSIGCDYCQNELDIYVRESLNATFDRTSHQNNEYKTFENTFLETSKKCMAKFSVPYSDTIETLVALKSLGKKIYIVTGKPQKIVKEILKKYNCSDFISGIIGYGEYLMPKPSPESLNLCISSFHLSLSETVYIGDSPNDIEAAKGAGIDGILISRDLTCNGISTLFELLRQIRIELLTVLSVEYDVFKSKKCDHILTQWCQSNGYVIQRKSQSSFLLSIGNNSELSINKNGILILSEYLNPCVTNIPQRILEWKENINTYYKTDPEAKPGILLKQYESVLAKYGKNLKCPFPSMVHYTLIAYNYIPINKTFLERASAAQDILWLLTKNHIKIDQPQLSITETLVRNGICVEQYTDTNFFSG